MLKFFKLNSIRDRILGGFLFLTLLILTSSIFSAIVIGRTRHIANLYRDINELQVYSLNVIKTDNDFFSKEIYDQQYLKTRKSSFITRRDSLNHLISDGIKRATRQVDQFDFPLQNLLFQVDSLLLEYNSVFAELESNFFKRGFKDEGIEGKMRYHAHLLESPDLDFERTDLLSLRRSEKDFLIRHDMIYVESFADQVKELYARKNLSDSALAHLSRYYELFIDLTDIQKTIGLDASAGLRGELSRLTDELSERYFTLAHYSYEISANAQRDAWIFHLIMMLLAIIFSILMGYWISKRISEPIARLSMVMEKAMQRYTTPDLALTSAATEINILTGSFSRLMNETTQQMNQLKKLNHELDNFLYSTAHDLRSPLASLLGILNLIRIESRQPEIIPYVEMMEKSIQRQEKFISQIVEFSKNKQLDVRARKVNLRQIIEEVFESHHYMEGALQISNEIAIQDSGIFYSDPNRLAIIFNNLISNAIRYADFKKTNPFIRISATISAEEAVIEFADNGIGIESKHMKFIFDMFYRASEQSKGSGLGLFIFAETIQKLNGLVTVESELGVGTRFFIRIPNLLTEYQLPFSNTAGMVG